MPYKNRRIAVIMPAYNAARTLERCYRDLPHDWVDDVILVDDGSRDRTVEVARTLPIHVHVHPRNRGYGGNQKTCYRLARERGADVAVMIHPDHQYDPKFLPDMVKLIVDGGCRAVFGSRMLTPRGALRGGMPPWKFVANIALTQFGNLMLGTRLSELHSGLRAYDMRVFDEIDIERNSDDFVFDTQIIIQMAGRRMKIGEVAIPTRYFAEASMIALGPSIRYGLGIVKNVLLYKTGLRKY
jgi:glycosyltransferase involved in cell wall biosynthesis